jgi:hypothetical protein
MSTQPPRGVGACCEGAKQRARWSSTRQPGKNEKICVMSHVWEDQPYHEFAPCLEAGKIMCHYNVSLPVVQPLRRLLDDKLAKSIESQKRILLSQTTGRRALSTGSVGCP